MEQKKIDRHLARIAQDGYTIIEDAIDASLNVEIRETIRGLFDQLGVEPKGNRAEGFATRRLYNLVPRAELLQQLPVQGNVLPIVEQLLEPECLLSGTTAMDIGPGEQLQGLHADDSQYLAAPQSEIRRYSARLRQLMGFELYRGVMGHIDGQSPSALIGADSLQQSAYAASSQSNPFGDSAVETQQSTS